MSPTSRSATLPAVIGVIAALSACSTPLGVAPRTAGIASGGAGRRVFLAAEALFDAAVVAADTAIRAGALPRPLIVRLSDLADRGEAIARLGRAAFAAGNAAELAVRAAALSALALEINTPPPR